MSLSEKFGSWEQKQAAIAQTQSWLNDHPEVVAEHLRTKYLALVKRLGSREQKQAEAAIAQTQSWLNDHPKVVAGGVRSKFLALVGKTSENSSFIKNVIHKQWQWMIQQHNVQQQIWLAFLPVLYHHASPDLYQPAIELALQQYPDNSSIDSLIFGYFRNYLDFTTCHNLATRVSQFHPLPVEKKRWQNLIYAANFFRGHDKLPVAEDIYHRIIGEARREVNKFPELEGIIDFANLSYAQLLLLTEPPQPDQAIEKLEPILKKKPRHGYAHLLMAQSYQAKGPPFYIEAKNHFDKAIEFGREKNGFFYREFGCFYRHAVGNIPEARHCFEQSLKQTINFLACVELAELEAKDGNFEQAKSLLQDGLSLTPYHPPRKRRTGKT